MTRPLATDEEYSSFTVPRWKNPDSSIWLRACSCVRLSRFGTGCVALFPNIENTPTMIATTAMAPTMAAEMSRRLCLRSFSSASCWAFSVAVWGLIRPVSLIRDMLCVLLTGERGVVTGTAPTGFIMAVALLTAASRPER